MHRNCSCRFYYWQTANMDDSSPFVFVVIRFDSSKHIVHLLLLWKCWIKHLRTYFVDSTVWVRLRSHFCFVILHNVSKGITHWCWYLGDHDINNEAKFWLILYSLGQLKGLHGIWCQQSVGRIESTSSSSMSIIFYLYWFLSQNFDLSYLFHK